MRNQTDHDPARPVTRLAAWLHDWWRRANELNSLPRHELERMAGEFGMTGSELESLAARGAHAADLVYERMRALGLSTADVDRVAFGLMRELEKDCARCGDKGQCRKDLAARPDDPNWTAYCPNAISLESIRRAKGRIPL